MVNGFFGRTDAKAETPVLWPPHAKSWLIGKDWCWEGLGAGGEGTTEDEMAGWHHWLDGRESEWTLGVGDGQGGLACCDSWGRKESDTTERLNWTELSIKQKPSKDLLHSTGNCTQYSVMAYMGKESKKEWIYVFISQIHFAVCLKLIQHCKSIIPQ